MCITYAKYEAHTSNTIERQFDRMTVLLSDWTTLALLIKSGAIDYRWRFCDGRPQLDIRFVINLDSFAHDEKIVLYYTWIFNINLAHLSIPRQQRARKWSYLACFSYILIKISIKYCYFHRTNEPFLRYTWGTLSPPPHFSTNVTCLSGEHIVIARLSFQYLESSPTAERVTSLMSVFAAEPRGGADHGRASSGHRPVVFVIPNRRQFNFRLSSTGTLLLTSERIR